jgi:predicted glycogen debranching enzyme
MLIASLAMPQGRFVLLSKFEDAIRCGDREYYFSCHQYPGFFFPENDQLERDFFNDLYPAYLYRAESAHVRKSIMMIYGENRVLIRYEILECPPESLLSIKPLLAFRSHHALSHRNDYLHDSINLVKGGFVAAPYDGMPSLIFQSSRKAGFHPDLTWLERFEYAEERNRGYDWMEDLFQLGIWEIPIQKGQEVFISVGLSPYNGPLRNMWVKEQRRRVLEAGRCEKLALEWGDNKGRENLKKLYRAADKFLITRADGHPAIIAGYPWFDQWGRDTLIALPGLTFCCGKLDEGISILADIARHERDGLLPNFFDSNGCPSSYNSVDTPLWYFRAIQQMLDYTGRMDVVHDVHWPVMKNILKRFITGTAYEISMQGDGLLQAGTTRTNLTWMDAMVHDRPVTPRWGYPVEVNALWYNALCFARDLAAGFEDYDIEFEMIIERLRQAFQLVFWIPAGGYLGDVFTESWLDKSIRPNQIMAVSLPHSPLEPHQQESVVRIVEQYLLTPVGLRTLAPAEPNYAGHYQGEPAARDRAYHQGTIWPWLIGHFGEAYLRVSNDRETAGTFLILWIHAFLRRHLPEAGIGMVSEIFDGDKPHRPGGCIAQAWSVAELIRLCEILKRDKRK